VRLWTSGICHPLALKHTTRLHHMHRLPHRVVLFQHT
jgi:hypothetical protein